MSLSEFVPPIAKKYLRKYVRPMRSYQSFDVAHNAIRDMQGYFGNNSLVDIVYEKTKRFLDLLNRNVTHAIDPHHLFLLSTIALISKKGSIKVLDFGGAFGTHYFIVKRFFPDLLIEWSVIELPEIIQKAQAFEGDELRFIDIRGDFDLLYSDVDLVLTSCTLQHVPDPYKVISFLARQKADYIAFLRLGLNESFEDLWFIHKAKRQDCGPGEALSENDQSLVAFPFCMLSEEKLQYSIPEYDLMLCAEDKSGTLNIPEHKIKGSNRLYQKRNLKSNIDSFHLDTLI